MEAVKDIVQNSNESLDIDSLDKNIRNRYPLLSEISNELQNTENEIKEMVHAFYERQKANIKVGEQKGAELNSKFIKLWQEKKRLEKLEFHEKIKTPEYQEMLASLRSKNQNAQD
jgi:hypothetical protein